MKRIILYILLICSTLAGSHLQAQEPADDPGMRIDDFQLKEYVSQNGRLSVVAIDTLGHTDESISGVFQFDINGFKHALNFDRGVAVIDNPLGSSAFLLLKHNSPKEQLGKYFFLFKQKESLKIYPINGMFLLLIPVALLFVAYLIKKLRVMIVILLLIGGYLYFYKGLDLSTLFESALMNLKK
ncbi:MAG TPA: hypothetical protein VK076_08715 [Candidatus Sphingobacterium stercoripullorum]|nr:hypothetical protein [Candidatus Sphingobacterium stercoripullorum]